ncbi:MAG TPA: AraC family transcriptional regulator [Armatimonadota bacterium]|nr:AraC family transcriptional regulator [Armatimonadota bacterium]
MLLLTPKNTNVAIYYAEIPGQNGCANGTKDQNDLRNIPHYDGLKAMEVHEEHEVNLITKGAGRYTFPDGQAVAFTSGDIILLPSTLPHFLIVDESITMRGIHLHPILFQNVVRSSGRDVQIDQLVQLTASFTPRAVSAPDAFQVLYELFDLAAAEYAGTDAWRVGGLRNIGSLMAITMIRLLKSNLTNISVDSAKSRVLNVIGWMERHYLEHIDHRDLAERASLSVSHFYSLFTQVTGCSPKAYLLQLRLRHAAALLMETDLSVAEIANRTGFDYLASFSHHFKAHYGVSSSTYRKDRQIIQKNQ